ncbi:MBL fold metallo-hydrolase [Saccharopolyspora cebuensis]|uniref:MBL fold metallo-hydrolase n=1 Tax=Saccharopolyspora cebuensis TaxID=418759 RepID=A0ABV4CPZ9_9PSEU
MKLTILGCSGSIPGPESPASGYLVESGGSRIVLDLGNGTLGALQRVADPFELDAVLFSHLHPDHCADFGALTVLRRYHPAPPYDTRQRRLPVFAPAEAPERFAALHATDEAERQQTDLSDVFDFVPMPQELRIGPFHVQPVPVAHVCPAWGFRITADDAVLAYTGDTGPCPALDELGRDADVLLAEASWPHHPEAPDGLHLSGLQAAEAAVSSGARRLLLTHLQPWSDPHAIRAEAAAVFDGPVEVVEPGREYVV